MNALTGLLQQPPLRLAGWVLVHFFWQGAGIALLLAVLLRLLNGASSHLRYLVICGALLACGLAPVATWSVLARKAAPPRVSRETPPARFLSPAGIPREPFPTSVPKLHDISAPVFAGPVVAVPSRSQLSGLQTLDYLLPYAVAIWFAGVLALTLRLALGWMQLQRIRRSGAGIPDPAWQERFHRLAKRMRIGARARLLQSGLVEVPTLIGWLRPMILLPASVFTGLSAAQLEAILAHELAHVRRHDYLVNLLQTAVETILFYHPAVWWIGRKLREERENCCDDIAVETMCDRAIYASALATLEESRVVSRRLALAASGGALLGRIRRIAGIDRRNSSIAPVIATFLIVAGLMASLGGRLASGQDSKDTGKKPAADASEKQDAPLQLVLDLSDGSRIVGAPSINQLKITTGYADLEIKLPMLRAIEFSGTNHAARVKLENGDLLNGQIAETGIELKTIVGQVEIPLAQVRNIRMTAPGGPLPEGLVLHYTFDSDDGEKVADESESGNDGSVHGATWSKEGKRGGAMSFNGDHEAVIIKNPASLQLQDFSIVAWIKRGDKDLLTKTGSGGGAVVFAYGQAGYGMGIDSNENLVLSKVGVDQLASKFKIDDDAWHHAAVTKEGSKVVFYLDGTAYPAPDYNNNFEFGAGNGVAPQTLTRPMRLNRALAPQGVAVGARGDTLDNCFLGLIDEVMVFKRALSGDEVKGIYESQK